MDLVDDLGGLLDQLRAGLVLHLQLLQLGLCSRLRLAWGRRRRRRRGRGEREEEEREKEEGEKEREEVEGGEKRCRMGRRKR